MGWFYFFVAEIGSNLKEAENFAQHFNGFSLTLSDGRQFSCASGYRGEYDNLNNFWATVLPKKPNGENLDIWEDCQEMIEISYLLYEHLRTAPTFRYALAGIEVEEFLTYEELIADGTPAEYNGLVISEDIWKKTDSYQKFVSFSPGYLWIPFQPPIEWTTGWESFEPMQKPIVRSHLL
ncbi:MAG: hypothetical protein ACRC2R_19735 [Xenococcaceae cyanobacterium]